MGRQWQIGDPVDYTTDGWMDAQNWGHGGDGDDGENTWTGRDSPDPRIEEYGKKAWNLYMDFKDEEALHYIDMALDLNDRHANNWNKKAIILEGMKRYAESEKCYSRSLELSPQNLVYDNKARMLYDWAVQLREDSKNLEDGLDMLGDARDKLIKAMRALPGENSDEDLEKYLKLWDSIKFYIDYEKKFQRNLETLKGYGRDELFTITGMQFFKNDVKLASGMELKLVREPENEHDPEAIAVYAGDEKIGYVANSDHTRFKLTSSASQLHNATQGEYLMFLERYVDIEFHIARIIR